MAVSYMAEGKALPIMFEFAMGDIDQGASISFISQYPGEDEILIPPLSYLEVTGEPFIENTEKGNITVFPCRISCNVKPQTIQEIETKRHHDLVAMMPYLYNDLCRDLDVLSRLKQENNLLIDDKTYSADEGCTFTPENVMRSDEGEIQEWFTTPRLHGIPTSVQLTCMWQFVGSGHSKGGHFMPVQLDPASGQSFQMKKLLKKRGLCRSSFHQASLMLQSRSRTTSNCS